MVKKTFFIFVIACEILTVVMQAESWNKILPYKYYNVVTNTPFGLVAGEMNYQIVSNPYNGLIISKDFGKTWTNFGLANKGITDINILGSRLLAGTYYQNNSLNGLFVTTDYGNTWKHIGPNYSASAVAQDENTLYFGTYSHGLWISSDNGETFKQVIGTNTYGPTINSLYSTKDFTIAAISAQTYITRDFGQTWSVISALSGKTFQRFLATHNSLFAASGDTTGLYYSLDKGTTWQKSESLGSGPISDLAAVGNYVYAGRYDNSRSMYSLYKSADGGKTWTDTGLNSPNNNQINRLTAVYANTNYLVGAVNNDGIYRMVIDQFMPEKFPFLDIPWDKKDSNELIDRISAYFDHQYPFLGYNYYTEPPGASTTTINFFGPDKSLPSTYYSSHSGIDFALPYGTQIKAPADGLASYYFCPACGNSIKINHNNGYQTIYEHLQENDLFTRDQNTPIAKNETIGKVGLTGRTSGSHLHFEVLKDSNGNDDFTDDFPAGRVDPFGWLDGTNSDPWIDFQWEDKAGTHIGTQSKYLWTTDILQDKAIFTAPNENVFATGNKSFTFQNIGSIFPLTLFYSSYSQPSLDVPQISLKYISNTSFLLSAFDSANNKIAEFTDPIHINIDLNGIDMTNVVLNSLKVYYFDPISKLWSPLQSIYDEGTKLLSAETNHLSLFAVFSDFLDQTSPQTFLDMRGETTDNWFIKPPLMSLTATDSDLAKIFYSNDQGSTWNEYNSPLTLEQNGIVSFFYRSSDINGNYESANEQIVRINLSGAKTKHLSVTNALFSTSY